MCNSIKTTRSNFCCKTIFIFLLIAYAIPNLATAKQQRNSSTRNSFVKEHPCPLTGENRLPCKGWIIDHVIPLCADGIDDPSNMQWQTISDAKAKDKEEWRRCREIKK